MRRRVFSCSTRTSRRSRISVNHSRRSQAPATTRLKSSRVFVIQKRNNPSRRTMEMKPAQTALLACAVVLVCTLCSHAQQKPCVTASKFGPNDQVGNVNYITPAKTLAATKLVTKGKSYRLGIETNKD